MASQTVNLADTYDWDTAFGTRFGDVNAAIVAQKTSPPSFSGQFEDITGEVFTTTGVFGPWQLTGGSGALVHMGLPISGGTVKGSSGQVVASNYSGMATVEVALNFLPQPANTSVQNLMVAAPQTTAGATATVLSFTFDPTSPWSTDSTAITEPLGAWLTANLQVFNNVFASVDFAQQAATGAFQWLTPTKISYAIATPVGAEVDDYVFGVLAMTEGRDDPNLSNQVSPNIIPAGANAGFLISTDRFLNKILLPNVSLLFDGATVADFDQTLDGTITNTQPLQFQSFALDSGQVIDDAGVATSGFQITVFNQSVQMQFIDLQFTYQPGYICHINFSGMSSLSIDSQSHLQMTQLGTPTAAMIMEETTGEEIIEILMGLALAAAGSVIGACVGGAADAAAARAAAVSASERTVSIELTEVLIQQGPPAPNVVQAAARGAGTDIGAILNGLKTYVTQFRSFFLRNWRKILGIAVGGFAGSAVSAIPAILNAYGEEDLTNIPTLNGFAEAAVEPTTWPTVTGYTVQSLSLNLSMQVGLTMAYATAPS